MPEITAAEFADGQFDFLIVGGGTAGLVVAARLSEAGFNVGVLEAGPAVFDNELISIPGHYGQSLGGHLDWGFTTVPQSGLGGRSLAWPRGKVLGGTSALNFMAWNRASREDYDAWRDLGNHGWGWEDLLPFFRKSETFHSPTSENREQNKLFHDPETVGKSGPIDISYAAEYSASHRLWHDTLHALGVETNKSHVGGSNVGVWTNLNAVNPKTVTRSWSTAYYLPNAARPNFCVLTEALVTEVILVEGPGAEWIASGVRFRHGDDEYAVTATREVVICAGSIQSPQILELSGIGASEVLTKAGIDVKVHSPNVGENLQDHIMTAMVFEAEPSHPNPDDLKRDPATATAAKAEYDTSKTGPLTVLANSMVYLPFSHVMDLPAVESIASKIPSLSGFAPQEASIRGGRFDQKARLGQIEYIFDLGNWSPFFTPPRNEGKKYATLLQILQYPFSHGSIHIETKSPIDHPRIDPGYYAGPAGSIDVETMVHCAKFADKIAQTKPLADIIQRRVFPPEGDVDLKKWVVDTTITDWHPVGTCAMGGKGGINAGVVDERLRVYGTKGLRVVDASIMPLQISAHLQATVYAIAEKGATMIIEDAGLSIWAKTTASRSTCTARER